MSKNNLWLLVFFVLMVTEASALKVQQTNRFGESLMEVRLRSFNNTGANEIYAGVSSVGTASNRTELNHVWTADNWIEINYDQTTDLLRVTLLDGIGNVISSLDYPNWEMNMQTIIGNQFSIQNLSALQIILTNRESEGELSFEDVELNGVFLGGDFDIPAGEVRPNVTNWLLNDYCFSSFNLYGRVVRSGVFSNSQENSKIEIRLGTDEPTDETVFANGFEFCH